MNSATRAPRVDAHQHFWALVRGDYRWLSRDLAPLWRDFGPQDLAGLLARHSIEQTVLVQAADSAAETEYLLSIARATPFVGAVVGWIDFESPRAPDAAAELARDPKLAGLRPMIQDVPDERWMLSRAIEPALRAMVELGLAFDALVKPRHLPHLAEFLARHPSLRVVIDHGAKPEIAHGARSSAFAAWRDDLRRIARDSSACVKLSGLVTEARGDWSIDHLRPFADALLEAFGPARTMWGSDWPVVDLAGGYDRWREATLALLGGLSERERDLVLGETAARFYDLAIRAPLARPTTCPSP